jgi:predicted metal-dependent hydrolase
MKENELFRRGVAHFNARRFFEAHEVWEELWMHAAEPEKTFLQGMIQIAAAFHHYGRGNLRGARSLLGSGVAKLEQFPPKHRGIDLARLRGEARARVEALTEVKNSGVEKLPKIRAG